MRLLPVVATFTICALISIAHAYRGDGRLLDRGWSAAHNRYTVDLGAVDLASCGRRTFVMALMPVTEFTVGLELTTSDGTAVDVGKLTTPLHLRLSNEKNELVFEIRAALSDWVLSRVRDQHHRGFLYLRGPEAHVPSSADTFRIERRNVQADGGWGTYFTPRRDGSYVLVIDCEAPIASIASARLVAHGGGWK